MNGAWRKAAVGGCLVALLAVVPQLVPAEDLSPWGYVPKLNVFKKAKATYDDPRAYTASFPLSKIVPGNIINAFRGDVGEMSKLWEQAVGFRSPDVVGKISPDIKPGKYTYKDLASSPGLKALFWPEMAARIRPGGPHHVGNISQFEVVPTRQRYWSPPIAKATLENEGKTQLNQAGYFKADTWKSGYPFPKPSGKFKAQQIVYNFRHSYANWEQNYALEMRMLGFDRNLKLDMDMDLYYNVIRLAGRTVAEPNGFLDKRAADKRELWSAMIDIRSPRDLAGVVQTTLTYQDPDSVDQSLIFLPSLRRTRKMSATDTQDPIMGQDIVYDDANGFSQKISPTRYPMDFKVTEEREYLVPVSTDLTEYVDSKTLEIRNAKFERRPMYVITLTEKDPNYVYSKRVLYIDKETFQLYFSENYDQKGRLYITIQFPYYFYPEYGMIVYSYANFRNHIDLHTNVQYQFSMPAFWSRNDMSLKALYNAK